ncbi:MAG: DNA-directed RNA polymerase subunit omega [Acidobacteriota bacterium]|nr:MAG: DNA-directed RNA polymerase subunit omega [Acidobacteriota bacterium]
MNKPIEAALDKIPSRFLLTTTVARRWENLVAGSPPLVEVKPGMSMVDVVLSEIIEERITIDEENQQIVVAGLPEQEQGEEPVFTEAFSPDAASVQRIVGPSEE